MKIKDGKYIYVCSVEVNVIKSFISQMFGIVWLHITDRQEIFYSGKKLISLVIMTQLIFCTLYPQLIGVIISYICRLPKAANLLL